MGFCWRLIFYLNIWKICRSHDFMGASGEISDSYNMGVFYHILKHLTSRFQIYHLFRGIFNFCDFIHTFTEYKAKVERHPRSLLIEW